MNNETMLKIAVLGLAADQKLSDEEIIEKVKQILKGECSNVTS
jgi:hypothetical protein